MATCGNCKLSHPTAREIADCYRGAGRAATLSASRGGTATLTRSLGPRPVRNSGGLHG